MIITRGDGDVNLTWKRSKPASEPDLLNTPELHIYEYPRCTRMVSHLLFTVFDVLYFDLEGKGISDGLFDGSDVLLCVNHGETTCMTCLCGLKCVRRVCGTEP